MAWCSLCITLAMKRVMEETYCYRGKNVFSITLLTEMQRIGHDITFITKTIYKTHNKQTNMAEELGNAIVAAAEKLKKRESISNEVATVALNRRILIVPLYQHTQKTYRRDDVHQAFEYHGFNTWYTFGSKERQYKNVYVAMSTITNIYDDSKEKFMYEFNQDKDLEIASVGRIVEESTTIEKGKLCKHHVEKKIVGLFQRSREKLSKDVLDGV